MAKTMKEQFGTVLVDIRALFSSGRISEITDVKAWNECENMLTLTTEGDEYITINTDNIDCMAIKPRHGDMETEQEKKGKWLKTDAYPHHVCCSECYKSYVTNEEIIEGRGGNRTYCTEAEFCPHCGVKMETEQEGK